MAVCGVCFARESLLTQLANHFACPAQYFGAAVVGKRKVECAAVAMGVTELLSLEHERGGAPLGGLGRNAGPGRDFFKNRFGLVWSSDAVSLVCRRLTGTPLE